MSIRILVIASCLAVAGCGSEATIPAPKALPEVLVPAGTANIEVVHRDQVLVFDHVKAVRRHDEDAGADRVLLVFSQQDVAGPSLTHPFQEFDVRRWSLANHPEKIRAVVSVLLDPEAPSRPLGCEVFAEPGWLQGACGQFDSSLDVTLVDGAVKGSLTMVDFFGMEYEDRGWRATGSFDVSVAELHQPTVVEGAAAIDSPQVRRLQAMEAALAEGGLAAMQQHLTPEAYAETMQAVEEWGEEEVLDTMQGIGAIFEDLEITDDNVSVRLYQAGELSRLVLEKKEENSTSTEYSYFRWSDGRWLMDS